MSGAEFKLVGRLVLANFRQHPGRMLLTALSTIAAASIVVWVVSGYDSMVSKFGDFADEYLGHYQLIVLPTNDENPVSFGGPQRRQALQLSPELLEALRQDPAVATVDAVFETQLRVKKVGVTDGSDDAADLPERRFRGPRENIAKGEGNRKSDQPDSGGDGAAQQSKGPRIMGGMEQLRQSSRSPILVGTDATTPPHTMNEGKWIEPTQADRLEAVITHDSAKQLGIKVGDAVTLTGRGMGREAPELTIIGITEQPKRLPPPKFMVGLPPTRNAALRGGPAAAAVYVPTKLAEQLASTPAIASHAGVVLKDVNRADEFSASWAARLATATPPAEARTFESVSTEVDNSTTFEGIRSQAYSATGISLLAALFIIFTTLSMGVHERIRQFAVLRAVVLTKSQVAAMIALEGVILGLIGWAGGLLAGWGLLTLMAWLRPGFDADGVALGYWSVILSGLCALGGSLAASILPAWRATHVSPLEAMAPRLRTHSVRFSWLATIAGLLLIAVNPLVVFFVPMADKARYGVSAALGCTSMAVGFVLLAPLTIVLTEKLLGPLLARLLCLNTKLLSTQLTANMWRTLGTTVALTLGLGLYVAMQTWGYSMLGPFTPGSWTPDVVIGFTPTGIADNDLEAVRQTKGLVAEQCEALAVKQVKFSEDITGFRERASATKQDSCVMVGVDPEKALGGANPMFKFEFAEGNRQEALAKFKQGRYCLVPDHFTRDTGLGVGKKLSVTMPGSPDKQIEYEVAGVVSMPGWHWMSKMGFRRGRAAGLMLAPFEQVRSDFDTGRTTLFWSNMDGSASEDEIKESLQPIADRNFDAELARARQENAPEMGGGEGPMGQRGRRGGMQASVTLRSADSVRRQIRERADGIIWALCQLPLITLIVTSLGVVNTVLASIRARRWDMGVLRALGTTRFALFRLIVAEALLVGIVACLLSLGFGVMAGYCGTGVTRYINIRGGQITPLIVPWLQLLVGFGITLGLCLLASMWPAISTGRAEPLRLLQAGRTAT